MFNLDYACWLNLIMMASGVFFCNNIHDKIIVCGIIAACLSCVHIITFYYHFSRPLRTELVGKSHIDKHATCMYICSYQQERLCCTTILEIIYSNMIYFSVLMKSPKGQLILQACYKHISFLGIMHQKVLWSPLQPAHTFIYYSHPISHLPWK